MNAAVSFVTCCVCCLINYLHCLLFCMLENRLIYPTTSALFSNIPEWLLSNYSRKAIDWLLSHYSRTHANWLLNCYSTMAVESITVG